MNLERDLFKRVLIDFNQLENYGFRKEENAYYYSKVFIDGFRADIKIDEQGVVTGKVYDLNFEEEYNNFRMDKQLGEFASSIKEEYIHLLEDIASKCGIKKYFITEQANRIYEKIFALYQDEPEFAWESSPGFGIFRNPHNQKWYGLIMNIDKSKLDKKSKGEVEAINVKLDSQKILHLLSTPGFYPAYHMNKKHWISIVLDETLTDEEIIDCIKESHAFTEKNSLLKK